MTATLAMVVVELEAIDEARLVLEGMEPFWSRWAAWGGLGTLGPAPLAIARLRALLGDAEGAEEAFAESIARCRASESPFFLADSLLYLGPTRAAVGDSGAAVTAPVQEAVQVARERGYGTVLRRGEAALSTAS